MMYLVGEKLRPPTLRFNYSLATACHYKTREGLRIYGPYDSAFFCKDQINCAVVYPSNLENEKETLINGLLNGVVNSYGQFAGFKSLFRIPLEIRKERRITQETLSEVQQAIRSLVSEDWLDLVMVLASTRNQQLYFTVKAELLGNGIPNQVVVAEKVRISNQLPWMLENIALQCYAKVGGTPWTVASSERRRELVIGISRAQDRQRNFVVGFITLFTQDGDYVLSHSMAPRPINWERIEEYKEALSQLIVDAYKEYGRLYGQPNSLVVHLCKRPGRFREIEAVEEALGKIGDVIPYALLHLNGHTNFRLFDTTHPTYIPETGIKVELSDRSALLLLDGRIGDQRRRRGMPRVLNISMDHRSTMHPTEFSRLTRQVFDFARVNWRGFNAQAVPATLYYSYLIARLVAEIGSDRWNAIASAGRLRDKAWFL